MSPEKVFTKQHHNKNIIFFQNPPEKGEDAYL